MSLSFAKFAGPAFFAAALAGAAPVSAAAIINCDSPTNASSCTFGNTDPVSGKFFDTYVFSIGFTKVLTGMFSNFYANILQNVNFATNGSYITGGSLPGRSYFTTTATPNPDVRAIGPITLGAGTYTVTVRGSSQVDGSYAGTLALGAVPEPASWALMILGFAMIGGLVRNRKAVARLAAA